MKLAPGQRFNRLTAVKFLSVGDAISTPVKMAKIFTNQGKSMTISEWSKHLGIKEGSLYARLERGWPIEKALSKK